MAYYVYMLASRPRGTLYIGVTGDVVRRVFEHRSGAVPGFHAPLWGQPARVVRGLR